MGRSAFSLAFTIEKMRDVFPALSHGWCGHSFKDFSEGFFKGSLRDPLGMISGISVASLRTIQEILKGFLEDYLRDFRGSFKMFQRVY